MNCTVCFSLFVGLTCQSSKMPIGPFGEILGTTGTLETLGDGAANYKSKVIAPRNPKLVRGQQTEFKVNIYRY